jgi:hypothetical protein
MFFKSLRFSFQFHFHLLLDNFFSSALHLFSFYGLFKNFVGLHSFANKVSSISYLFFPTFHELIILNCARGAHTALLYVVHCWLMYPQSTVLLKRKPAALKNTMEV